MTLIYTDGSCINNGKHNSSGAYGFIVIGKDGNICHRFCIGESHDEAGPVTNNRMEMKAFIAAFEYIERNDSCQSMPYTLYTDSKYLRSGIMEWSKKWRINGWKATNNKDVKNKDLWIKALALADANKDVAIEWVKGHSESVYNNAIDELVNSKAKSLLK